MKSYLLTALVLALPLGCSQTVTSEEPPPSEDAITSNDGKPLEVTFEGSVLTDSETKSKDAILSQLEYLQGMFTRSVGGNAEFAHAKLTNIREAAEGDSKRVTYTAAVPVIWPKNAAVPTTYAVALPLDARKLSEFNDAYDGKCGTNEYGRETFWHDWNPAASGCVLGADVHKATGTVRTNPRASTGKYLEYDRVLSDGRLDVVGVFGIISSFTPSDDGVREFNTMVTAVESGLKDEQKTEVTPGNTVLKATKITGKKTLNGREITVSLTAILTHSVSDAGSDFDELYAPATKTADYIYYGGHSGLGTNIRSLSKRALVEKGKYQVVYLNGCQTFGYLGTTWNDKKREANGASDPEGTKDLDIFLTGLPAYDDNGRSMLAIYRAMEDTKTPKKVNDILKTFSSRHLNVVIGEDDNVFKP